MHGIKLFADNVDLVKMGSIVAPAPTEQFFEGVIYVFNLYNGREHVYLNRCRFHWIKWQVIFIGTFERDDETRAKALASTTNWPWYDVDSASSQRKKLVELADKYNVDIDKKAKVDELHERLSEALYQSAKRTVATMVVL